MRGSLTLIKLKYKNTFGKISQNEKMALDFHDLVLKHGDTGTQARQAMLSSLME